MAKKYEFTTGKWMLMTNGTRSGDNYDRVWKSLVQAFLDGQIDSVLYIKVPGRDDDKHSTFGDGFKISFVTKNFSDDTDVRKAENSIRK